MEGKQLPQMDVTHAVGMAKELVDFEQKNQGEYSAWTNSMFGGMPAYQIKGGPSYNIYLWIQRVLRLGLPFTTVSILFMYLLGFYVLLISLKFNKWISLAGAIAFAFGSYNIIIIAAGHITKTYAIGYMAPVVAGVILTYDKKYLWGGLLTMVALGLQVSTNHVQITYYMALMLGIYAIVKFVYALKEKAIKEFAISSGIVLVAVALAIIPNITNLWTTYEYGKYSNRGKSEITDNTQRESNGLDKTYALGWSYGVGESFTLMIPNVKGGASGSLGEATSAMEKADPQFKEYISKSEHYWGEQPFTSGPVYAGAIIVFLFVLGLFIVNGPVKWWLLSATVFGLFLSWGRNFPAFTDLFFYYFPLYNKFRTVSMILVIVSFAMPLLGMYAVKEMVENPNFWKEKQKQFHISFGITAGLCLLFLLMPSLFFNFTSYEELSALKAQQQQSPDLATIIPKFIENLEMVRISVFKSDVIRSLIFILLAAASILMFSFKKLQKEYLIAILGVLVLVDLWTVDKRYLSEKNFEAKTKQENQFYKSAADDFILKDVDPNYRVLNLTMSPFNDGYTPYFHKSIGGYHGAKLRRYQDLADKYLNSYFQAIQRTLQDSLADQKMNMLLPQLTILNMLNAKYIIYDRNSMPIINFNAYGNAWFVSNYKLVDNADQEIAALKDNNPKTTAIIDKKFAEQVTKLPLASSLDSAKIELVTYKPNHLTYKARAFKDQLAIFSEIYYKDGWNAYIDGNKVEHLQANYVLRGLVVPAGNHKIEFKFEPRSYEMGQTISIASSILIVLLILGVSGKSIMDYMKNEKNNPVVEEPVKTEAARKGKK